MKKQRRFYLLKEVPFLAALIAAHAFADMIPMETDKWGYDPRAFEFSTQSVRCGYASPEEHFALCTGTPMASNVTFSAIFVPEKTDGGDGACAGIAVAQGKDRLWTLALVQNPGAKGAKTFEFVQRAVGDEAAAAAVKQTVSEGEGAWEFGKPYLLQLALGTGNAQGMVMDAEGRLLMRKSYEWQSGAVSYGRIALRERSFFGSFNGLAYSADDIVPERMEEESSRRRYVCNYPVGGETTGASGRFRLNESGGRFRIIDPRGNPLFLVGLESAGTEAAKSAGCNMADAPEGETLPHFATIDFAKTFVENDGNYNIILEGKPAKRFFPNVFSPQFREFCQYRAKQICAPATDDPWIVGWYFDNSLAGWDEGDPAAIAEAAFRKPKDHSAKKALFDWIWNKCGGTMEQFRSFWGTRVGNYEEFCKMRELPSRNAEQIAVKQSFGEMAIEKYFSAAGEAVRAADPYHLSFGVRVPAVETFPETMLDVAGRSADVLAANFLPKVDLDWGVAMSGFGTNSVALAEKIKTMRRISRRPVFISSWSLATEAETNALNGVQVFAKPEERAAAADLFLKTALSLPELVGCRFAPGGAFADEALANAAGAIQKEWFAFAGKPAPQKKNPDFPYISPAELQKCGFEGDIRLKSAGGESEFSASNETLNVDGKKDRFLFGQLMCRPFVQAMEGDRQVFIEPQDSWCLGGSVENGVLIVDVEFEWRAGANSLAMQTRLHIPANSKWGAVELLSVTNASDETAYGFLKAGFRVTAPFRDGWQNTKRNIWHEDLFDARFDNGRDKKFAGWWTPWWLHLSCPPQSDPKAGLNADVALSLPKNTELKPETSFVFERPPFIVCAFSQGTAEEWKKTLEDIKGKWTK